MDKILLALAELKNFLTAKAENETKVAAAQADLVVAQGLLATAAAELSARDTTVATLTAELATANAALVASAATVATLTAAKDTATTKADETLAALGVDPKTIPAAPGQAAAAAVNVSAQLDAIKDPTARTVFFRANKAALRAANLRERSNQ
ncbi:MAG: hypothetical protein PHQ12_11025 [Chthoniobacteraceae bacterium]|nr:hypothetical protein [Chthoniobacteraceae bacterium]